MSAYFSKDFVKFLRELDKNNNRDWFNKNKERYIKEVKEPFEKLVSDLILRVRGKDPEVKIEPKEAIFRIYRDVRFSHDKTPYKTHVSAVIGPGGKKHKPGTFGIYLQIDSRGTHIYGGVHQAGPSEIEKIRKHIVANQAKFKKLLEEKKFKSHYNEIIGDTYKRIPKDYEEAAKKQPLLWNKEFYYKGSLPAAKTTSSTLVNDVMKFYEAAIPLNKFFAAAIKARG